MSLVRNLQYAIGPRLRQHVTHNTTTFTFIPTGTGSRRKRMMMMTTGTTAGSTAMNEFVSLQHKDLRLPKTNRQNVSPSSVLSSCFIECTTGSTGTVVSTGFRNTGKHNPFRRTATESVIRTIATKSVPKLTQRGTEHSTFGREFNRRSRTNDNDDSSSNNNNNNRETNTVVDKGVRVANDFDNENNHVDDDVNAWKQYKNTPRRRSSLRSQQQRQQRLSKMTETNHNDSENNNNNPLMIACTRPSQLASLHPAVRLALLHDELQYEFHAIHNNTNIDTNVWHT